MKLLLTIVMQTANAGCPLVPTGAIRGGSGSHTVMLEHQQLGFHHCDSPLVDGTFDHGTKCRKISCFGKMNHIFTAGAECVCLGEDCQWMQQENKDLTAIPSCPRGCPENPTYTMDRCRNNFMNGNDFYEENGMKYFWPGQRCKRAECNGYRKPKSGNKNGTISKFRYIIPMYSECVCPAGNLECVWSDINDHTTTAFNEDVDLECAEWTNWNSGSECKEGFSRRTRKCLENQVTYELAGYSIDEDIPAIGGFDCKGESEDYVAC